jgi:hypothetical protein
MSSHLTRTQPANRNREAQGSPRQQLFLSYRFRHSRESNFGSLTRAHEVYIFLRRGCHEMNRASVLSRRTFSRFRLCFALGA